MKTSRYLVLAGIVVLCIVGAGIAQEKAKPEVKPAAATAMTNPAFEKFKTLAGEWESKTPDGKTFGSNFRVISAGSAVAIDEIGGGEEQMLTVVHPDGADMVATHYCSAKNQPRFVSVPSSDPNAFKFKLKDVTNLASPEAGHMVAVVFTIVDPDHHTEAWTFRANGKEMTETFNLTRKK